VGVGDRWLRASELGSALVGNGDLVRHINA